MTDIRRVEFNGQSLAFEIANQNARWRFDTFETKEPETLRWIVANFTRDDIFVDVGANIGVYTIAASVGAGCRVLAFEPEAENFALLNRNIRLNHVSARVDAFPLALSNATGLGRLRVSKPEAGQSGHDLENSVFGNGTPRTQGCVFATLADCLGGQVVDHIKIDVDGQEPLVLEGIGTLLLHAAKSVLVEVSPSLPQHREIAPLMAKLGFKFDSAQVERARRKSGPFAGYAEYIFYR